MKNEQINIVEKMGELTSIITQMLEEMPTQHYVNEHEKLLAAGNTANLIIEAITRLRIQTKTKHSAAEEKFIQSCRNLDEPWSQYLKAHKQANQVAAMLLNACQEQANACKELLDEYQKGEQPCLKQTTLH